MENQNLNRRTTNNGSRNTSKGGERQLGENRVAVAIIVAKVYDDDVLSLLMSKLNQGEGMWFNHIPEASNENKDKEAYDDDAEMEDVEREDEFYGFLIAPHT